MSTRFQIPMKPAVALARHLASAPFRVLRRKCACGGSGGSTGECAECAKKKLQRSAASGGLGTAPPIVHDVLRSPGQPLDARTRAFFEPRFGHDFSKVRIHTDSRAAESARAVNALAYTVGHDIVFEQGRFAPSTGHGRQLLGHELTHVVQQSAQDSSGAFSNSLRMGATKDAMEQEADRTVATSVTPEMRLQSRRLLQRQSDGSGSGADQNPPASADNTSQLADTGTQQDAKGGGNPCAGWESDPQSFSIQLARVYYRTEYPNPKSKDPYVSTVTGAWDPKEAFFVNFDNGDTVGVSMKWIPSGGPAVACTKQGTAWCFHRCEYTYQCDTSGAISFTKTRCRDTAP